MLHFHDEIRIEAPVEHVWACFSDTSRWEEWMPARFSDFSGPLEEVGTTFRQSVRVMGFEQQSTCTVVEFEPPRLYREHMEPGPMENCFRCEPDGDATRFVFEADYELPARLPGFVKRAVASGWIERNHRKMLADLKALAEANVPAQA
ncbi:MAG: SRPBCC family protein [Chloroflexota bacterium]|jgi:ligand-binding SRPBCC domain-containing protein